MFNNYLKIALRNILRYKGHSLVNILGLATGMACCILILLYVGYELSFDKFHEKADHIYRLGFEGTIGGRDIALPFNNAPTGPALVEEIPEILNAVRMEDRSKVLVEYANKQFYENNVVYADNSILEIFTFPLIEGSPHESLKAPYTAVLTEKIARKYFGDKNPVGEIITFNSEENYTITGVVKNVPSNSQFTFDILCSFATLIDQDPGLSERWMQFSYVTYLLVDPNSDIEKLRAKLPVFVEAHMGGMLETIGGNFEFTIQPLKDIHLYSNMEVEVPGNSDIRYVYVFTLIAFGILVIAYINFINMVTARSSIRAKEVGIRKTLGACRSRLALQFIAESVSFSIMALALALIMVELFLPAYRSISGCDISLTGHTIFWLLPTLIASTIVIGILAGIYPALYLASFKPVSVLKGGTGAGYARSRLRSALVIGQFTISIILIAGTIIILGQLRYMKNRSLGFEKEHVVVVDIRNVNPSLSYETIKEKFSHVEGVSAVTAASEIPGKFHSASVFLPGGFSEGESQIMSVLYVDYNFFEVMGMGLAEGRYFIAGSQKDMDESILINQTALGKFGWSSGIGRTIKESVDESDEWHDHKIIGVINDYHMISLHQKIDPLFVSYSMDEHEALFLKIKPGNIPHTLSQIDNAWRALVPDKPFDYYFLDRLFDEQYRNEERLSTILLYFTSLAIFIACLGLYGMSSFAIEQRTKEIGIRKVMGASIAGIMGLMTRNFLVLVTISNLIAWPVAYLIMRQWLTGFAYRIGLNIGMFMAAGVIALIISLITISYQAIKAALTDPVKTLRYE